MIIQTNSWKLAIVARLCRLFPPGVSGVFLRLFPTEQARRRQVTFQAGSSLADFVFRPERIDWVSNVFAIRGFYDWATAVVANALCRSGDTILEVGANIGTESLVFSRVVGPRGELHCFEPLPENVRILKNQIEINRIGNIHIHQVAVADQPGTACFRVPTGAMNFGEGYLVSPNASGETSTIEVQCVTLDALFESGKFPSPRLICIDAQGAELLVMRGAEKLLREKRPYLLFEIAPEFLAIQRHTAESIFNYLHTLGYQCWQIYKWGLRSVDLTRNEIDNWVAIPSADEGQARQTMRMLHRRIKRAAIMPLLPGLNPAVISRNHH